MNEELTIDLFKVKCSQLSFSDLESFQRLLNKDYQNMISNTNRLEEKNMLINEIAVYNAKLDEVISNRTNEFIHNHKLSNF